MADAYGVLRVLKSLQGSDVAVRVDLVREGRWGVVDRWFAILGKE